MEDTLTPLPKDPNDTSGPDRNYQGNSCWPKVYYTRYVRRYAKKHKITVEQAFKRLYKQEK
jgi:hypothetical protein